MMGEGRERVEALLAKLESVNREVIQTCESCSEDQILGMLQQEGRPMGVVFHHIAVAYSVSAEWAIQIATGAAMSEITMDDVDAFNADHAREVAGISKDAVLDALRNHAAKAAELLSPMTDAQMGRRSSIPLMGFPNLKAGSLFNAAAIEHARGHLQAIKSGLEQQ